MISLAASLGGCAAAQVASGALNAMGVSLPDALNSRNKVVDIQVKGSDDMNSGDDGKALSAIVRLYKLKEQNGFLSAPYGVFGRPDKEKQAMGDALVETKELVVSPMQVLKIKEKLDADTPFLGVVALFRSPAAQRWRIAYASEDIRRSGVTIEIGNCQMIASVSAPIGMKLKDSESPLPIKCN